MSFVMQMIRVGSPFFPWHVPLIVIVLGAAPLYSLLISPFSQVASVTLSNVSEYEEDLE